MRRCAGLLCVSKMADSVERGTARRGTGTWGRRRWTCCVKSPYIGFACNAYVDARTSSFSIPSHPPPRKPLRSTPSVVCLLVLFKFYAMLYAPSPPHRRKFNKIPTSKRTRNVTPEDLELEADLANTRQKHWTSSLWLW
ncbi:hypothetical protein C8R44DRAFT_863041, partial [Mycena epipterygia]